jgi:hypothetical protein
MGCAQSFDVQHIETDGAAWLRYVFGLRKYMNARLGLHGPVGGLDEFSELRVRMYKVCEMAEPARAQHEPAPIAMAAPVAPVIPVTHPSLPVSAVLTSSSGTTFGPGWNGAPTAGKSSISSPSYPISHGTPYLLDILLNISSHHSCLLQIDGVLTKIDFFSLANEGKQRAGIATAGSSFAFARSTTPVPTTMVPENA